VIVASPPAASNRAPCSTFRDRDDDREGLLTARDRLERRGIRRLERQILLAGVEPQDGAPPFGHVVADRPTQHGIPCLAGVEDRGREDAFSQRNGPA
jgi:hypothetical protein